MNRNTHKNLAVCRVCQREASRPFFSINDLTFCREHKREFKQRQRMKVTTSDLNPLWGDTLTNWRERPSELDKETRFRLLTTSFMFRLNEGTWLIFERAYYEITLPHRSRPHKTIYNPRKKPWYKRKQRRNIPAFHRLSDYIVVNSQTNEIRYFVNLAINEVVDDLRGIKVAPNQEEFSRFWGKRGSRELREKINEHLRNKIQSSQARNALS